jgi:hypothetical protein
VLDIIRKACWWLWWLKCDVGQTGTPVPLWEVVELDGSMDRLSNPRLLHISDTTKHGQSLLILGQPISKFAAKWPPPDRHHFSTGIASEPPAVIDYVFGQFTGIVGGEEGCLRTCVPSFCMTLNGLDSH